MDLSRSSRSLRVQRVKRFVALVETVEGKREGVLTRYELDAGEKKCYLMDGEDSLAGDLSVKAT